MQTFLHSIIPFTSNLYLQSQPINISYYRANGASSAPSNSNINSNNNSIVPIVGGEGGISDARVLNVDIDMPIDPNEPTYCLCNRVMFPFPLKSSSSS